MADVIRAGMEVYLTAPHATRRWEDGLRQFDVPRKHMREMIAEEDSSAGKGVPLTTGIVRHLAWIGQAIGPLIDRSRKAACLDTLREVNNHPDCGRDRFRSGAHGEAHRVAALAGRCRRFS